MKKFLLRILFIVLFITAFGHVYATGRFITATTSGDFFTASNWDLGVVPTTGDVALIPSGKTMTANPHGTFNSNPTHVNNPVILIYGILELDGDDTVTEFQFDNAANIYVFSGGQFVDNSYSGEFNITNANIYFYTGGKFVCGGLNDFGGTENFRYSETQGSYTTPVDVPTTNGPFTVKSNGLGSNPGGSANAISINFGATPPPMAATLNAGTITSISASLNGLANPGSATTNISFDYGTSSTLATSTNVPATTPGSSISTLTSITSTAVTVSPPLLKNTTYYYRAKSTNTIGTTYGDILNFTTLANVAPILASTNNITYTENSSAAAINSAIVVSDVDNTTQKSAVITITNFQSGQDLLAFTNTGSATMGDIAVLSNAGGILSLTSSGGAATLAQWQTALRAVTYANSSDNPVTTARSVTFTINDGTSSSSALTSTINITAVNDAPVLTVTNTLSYTENGAAAAINPNIVVNDVDNTTLANATVTIVNYVAGQDALSFTNVSMGNIAILSNSGGTLTLNSASSSATVAQWQAALRAVLYSNSSDNPSITTRTVNFTINDGAATSNTLANSINIIPVDDAPVLAASSVLSYTENDAATAINTSITVTDVDNSTLASATVTIAAPNFVSGQDVLSFTNVSMGNIVGTYNAATGILSLSSAGNTATLAQWQAALRAVQYSNSSDNPSTAARTVNYTINDGTLGSNTITSTINITAVNDAPVLTVTNTLSYTENGAAAAINPNITLSDLDNTTMANATVTIVNYVAGQDALSFTNVSMGNIAILSNSGGTLTLNSASSSATVAQWQAALRAVLYSNSSDNPSITTRTVNFTINDGAATSNTLANSINIIPVDDAPVLAASSVLSYTENDAATAINTSITVTDVDNSTLASATVTIAAPNFVSGQDVLSFTNVSMGNIVGTYNAATGILSLSSAGNTATLAQWQAALRAVQYSNSSDNPSTAARTVNYTINDGTLGSNTVASTINITAVNDAPVLASTNTLNYIDGAAAAAINPAITVSDVDNSNMQTAIVSISAGFATGDILAATTTGTSITATYTAGTGVLTLTGTDTKANYQTVLQSVKYSNSSTATATKTIQYGITDRGLNDGGTNTLSSSFITSTINIAPPPTIQTSGTLSALSANQGAASPSTSFFVNGSNMQAGILVTPPSGFEVSTDNTTFTPTVTVGAAGTIATTQVYVRLSAADAAATYSGNIVLTSANATTVNVATASSTVTAISNDATLSALTISAGTISSTFSAATTGYAITTAGSSTTVTATRNNGFATLQVQLNGGGYSIITSGTASGSLTLIAGTNTINVKATAQDGTTVKTYTITVLRPPGNALAFDGTDDNVTMAAPPTTVSGSYTIEAWVKPNTTSGTLNIFSSRNPNDSGFDLKLVNGASIHSDIGTGAAWMSTNADVLYNYTAGQWMHIAYVVTSSAYTIYINGVQANSGALPAAGMTAGTPLLVDANHYLYIGYNARDNNYFNGAIDEVKIYNTNLSAANIQADMASTTASVPASLVYYYDFDNGAPGADNTGLALTLKDKKGTYDGTLTGFTLTGTASNFVATYATVIPTAPTAASVTTTGFTVNWAAVTGATSYKLDVSAAANFSTFVSGFNDLTVAGTSQAVTGLTAGTTYYYRMRGVSTTAGTSVNSPAATQTTLQTPVISSTGTLMALNTTFGTASSAISFNLSAINAIAGVLVTPPTGFEVSTNNITFTSTVTVGAAGTIPSTPVYVRLSAADPVGSYSGNIVLTSAGATSVNVATVTSSVTAIAPVVTTTSPTTGINTTTATLAGNVTSDGGVAITTRGIVVGAAGSPIIGGSGVINTTASGTTGIFTASTAALTASTTYHYRAYAINSAGTTYGTDQTFTTGPNALDNLSLTSALPAAGAYSLRLLSSNYTGPLTRITIGTNYYDVYPDATSGKTFSLTSPVSAVYTSYNSNSTGATASLLSSVISSNSATVAIWYDQSGNGYNALQSATGTQPQIIASGVVNKTNGLATVKFSGSQWLVVTSTAFNSDLSASVVYNATSANTTTGTLWYNMNGIFGSEQGGVVADFGYGIFNNKFTAGAGDPGNGDPMVAGTTTVNNGQSRIGSWTRTNSSGAFSLYSSGAADAAGTLPSGTRSAVTSVAIGSITTNGGGQFNGTISEMTLFPAVYTTAQRQTVEGNQGTYYGITITSPTIAATGTLSALSTQSGIASTSTTINVSGTNTTAGILVTPPTGFEVSLTSGSGYAPTVTAGTSGTIASTPVYVRLKAADAAGTYSGNIVLSSTDAVSINVPTISSTVANSTDATLSALTISSGTLAPVFATATTTYSVSVPNAITSFTLTPTVNNSNATVKVNSIAATSGSPSGSINLSVGLNAIPVTVTAQDGTTTQTYTVNVTRADITIVASIAKANTSPTNQTSVNYTVTFGSAITGLTASNFSLTGTATGTSIGTPTGSGTTWTVPVTTGAVEGTIILNLANATGLSKEISTTLPFAGETYILDKTAPAQPTGLAATFGDTQVVLNWTLNAESDVNHYNVYSGTSANPTNQIAQITQGTATYTNTGLTNGTAYYYNIAAVDNAGNMSPVTTDVTATPKGSQTITFNTIASKTFGDADFDPAATSTNNGTAITYTSDNTAVATIVSGKIHIVAAGSANIIANQAADASHTAAAPATKAFTVNQLAIAVTATAKSKTFGDADPALTYTYTGILQNTDAFTGSLTRAAGENIGDYQITQGTLALSSNYALTYTPANLTIGTRAIAVTATAKNKTFGDTDPALTYTYTGTLQNTDAFAGSLTRAAGENIGDYQITQGTLALSSNYALTYTPANLTIGTRAIAVTATAKSKTFGDADPALTYTYTGILQNTDAFAGSLTRAAGENIGDYQITQGTLALSSNYALTYTPANLTIGTRAIAVTATAKSKTFGDADPALTYTYTGILQNTDAFAGSLTRAAGENIGDYQITQGTLALSSNYALTYTPANLTIGTRAIAVTATAKSKTFGDADPALTYTYTGILQNTDAFAGSLTRAAGENIGDYQITQGTLALSSNYALTYTPANLTIGTRAIAVTATAKSKTFGDADPALTYTYTGILQNTDAFAGSLTRAAGENIGDYQITQGTLALSSNYALTYTPANLTIGTRAIAVTATAKSKTFGDADPALTYTYTGILQNTDAFAGSLTRAAGENIGDYQITQGTLALSSNYALTYTPANLTIGTRAIAVTATAKSKTFGDADPALTYTYTGILQNTDAFAGSLTRAAGENIGDYQITQGTLALSSNYALTYTPANLTIGTRAIAVTATAKSKTFGDADPALTYTYTGILQNTDAFAGSLTRAAGENIGDYQITQGTLALSSNYALTYTPANLTIGTRAIAVTATAKSKTFGDADPALTYTYTGILQNTDAFAGSLTRAAGENIGDYQITQGTLALSSNYALTYTPANLTIGTRAIAVTATAKSKTFGDADPALTYTYTGILQNTDAFAGSLTRAAGENIGDYQITQGTLALSSNYALTYTPANLTIGTRAIAVTATAKSKTFGDADPALTYTYTGILQNTDAFAGSLTRAAGENIGDYQITQGTLALSSNYALTYTPANLTIGTRAIAVTATAKSKTFGDADPALTYTYTGILQNTDAFAGSLTRAAGENIGDYQITQGTLSPGSNYVVSYTGNTFTISKATITGVTLTSNSATYDGTAKSLAVTNLPAGATVTYTGNGQTNAGTYTVTATVSQANYNDLTLTATLTINNNPSISGVTLANSTFTYDGTAKSLAVAGLPAGATVTYTGNSQTNAGTYTVTATVSQANYNDLSLSAQLTISKATITGVTLTSNAATYDGTAKSLAVAGLPAGATVSYSNNGQTNAGRYTVTATVSQANYNDLTLTATLTINSNPSISGVTLANGTFTYDGTAKSLAVAGLPAGATVSYTNNDQTNAGVYTITATVSLANYNDLSLSAQLTISKTTITGVTLTSNAFTYDGTAKSLAVAGLPAGATVSYSNNGQTNAGVYTITATISQANYNDLTLTATLTINNNPSISGVTLANGTFTYDGTAKSLAVAGLPAGATVSYTNNDQTNAGVYTITATVSLANYNDLSLSAQLTISKATITGVTLTSNAATYDGTAKSLGVTNLPAGATVTYTNNGQTNAGVYTITATVSQANYNDLSLSAQLTISKATITGVTLTSNAATYDGTAKSLAVAGLPAGATVSYTNNDQTNAGTYTVTATVSQANYNDLTLTATLTINNNPSISGVTLANGTFTYDGTAKSLAVAGLPADATVSYTNNGQTNAGTYTVTATVSQVNYNDLTLTATLTINNNPSISGVTLANGTFTYDGTAKSLAVTNLPAGATVTYTGNGQTSAGAYTVTATVSQANYNDLTLTATLTINNNPSISGVTLANGSFTYDGTAKSLAVAGLPAGATVSYSNNGQTNAGRYTVTATVSQANYNDLTLTATLTINSNPSISGVTLANGTFTYDGTAKSLAVAGLPAGATVSYTNNGQTNAGTYTVTATVSQANYNDLSLSAQLTISKATITGVTLTSNAATYDGTAKSLAVAGLPAGATVSYTNNDQTNAGTYTVTATVSQANYNDLTLTATLTINNNPSISGVTLANGTFTYDGTAKSLAVAGLPAGATVSYTNNDQTNAGVYTITATVSLANYNDLSLSAQLTISKATITGVTLTSNAATYDGTAKSLGVTNLPAGATVTYTNNGQTNAGVYTITATVSQANYNDLSLSAQLTISKATITGVTLTSNAATYDGTAKSLAVAGLPAGATVSYTNNDQTNAGTYTVTATVSQANYNDLTLTATLTINNNPSISGVTLANGTFTYDGTAKSLAVAGLPADATVSYTNNGQTNAGTYTVTATVSQVNYNDLTLTATLTINNNPSISGVTLANGTFTYDGTAKSLAVAGLPAGATVSYTNNGQTNAGAYTITATVSQANYNDLSLSAQLTISKATITGVTLTSNSATYDGTAKSLAVTNLPAGATVTYTGNGQTNAGTYTITATVSQANYNDLTLTATLTINNNPSISGVTLANGTFTYDGTAKSLAVAGLPAGATVSYTNNGQTNAGTYTVTATVSQANYNDLSLSAQLTISKATITGVTLTSNAATYDGTAKSLAVAGLPAGATVSYTNNDQTNAGTYTVTATVSQANYNDLTLTATLTINNNPSISGVTLANGTFTYDGTAKSLTVAGLPADATVSYTNNGQTNAGTYTVTATVSQANYNDLTLTATLTINNNPSISGVTLANGSFTYDGTAKSLAVAGLPAGATVSYTNNGQTNAGTYTITATVSQANYNDLTLTATLTINNNPSISGVTLANGTFTYDGTAKSLAVAGLPAGATVSYTNNGQTNAGAYTITATLSQANYNDLSLSAQLTISKATITGVTLTSNAATYDGTAKSLAVTNLPAGATVTYTNNGQTNAGVYTITATVSQANYNDLSLSAQLTISKATITGVTLTSNSATYDGTAKSLAVTNLPAGATVTYTGNGQTSAGAYTVTATVSQANYNDLTLTATLTINNNPSISGVTLANGSFTYDGTAKSLAVAGLPAGATVSYSNNGQTNAGRYTVTATVSQANYNDLTLTATLTINSNPSISGVTLANGTFTYDGTAKSLAVAGLPAGATVSYTNNDQTNAGVYTITATVSLANYNDLSLSAQLTISKTTITGVTLTSNAATYDGTAKSLAVTGLPAGATVSYSNNGQTSAGAYTVTATVSQANYNDLTLTATLTINNNPSISGVTLANGTFTYDGTAKSLAVAGLPAGATVSYTNNDQTNAGVYTITATVSLANYNDLSLSAQLTISKATITGVTLTSNAATYDGTAKSLGVTNLPAGATVTYTNNGQTNAGVYTITATVSQANYNDLSLSAQLTISKATITGVTLTSNAVTYDGIAKSLAVAGLPSGATVSYTGNGQTNAGTYTVTATVSQANYNDLTLTATLTINNNPSISGVTLANGSFTYDGTAKSLAVTGLPAGATVTYTGNGQTNAGAYTITATVSQPNYNDLTLTATLTINNNPSISGVTLANGTFTYDGTPKSLAVAGLPAGATVSYTNNGQTNAGAYTITATVSQANYNDLSLSAQLTISKATITGVTLTSNSATYDGTAKSLAVTNLPAGATVTYTGNGQTNAGTYTVTATVSQANYNDLTLTATLTINNNPSISGVTLANGTFTYDGTAKSLAVAGLPAGATVAYSNNGQTNTGTYTVTATVSQANYNDLSLSAQLTISKATITGVTLTSNAATYDGTAKSLAVAGLPAGATVSYTNNDQTNAGTYTVTATVSQANYNDLTLTATLTINNNPSISGVTLANGTFTYDGTAKSLAVAGLPAGATVSYTNNGQTNAGAYTITATLSQANYNDLSLSAQLTISKATITGVTLTSNSATYDGTAKSLAVTNLPAGATVTYTNNGQTNAGTYTITATVSQANYNDLTLTATLTINSNPSISGVTLANGSFTYDDTPKSLAVAGLPAGATVSYTNNGQTNAGTYTVTATVSQANYNDLSLSAQLTISKATITGVTLTSNAATYDGTAKSLAVAGLPAGATVSYTNNDQTNAGTYTVTATISQANYNDLTLTATLTINNNPSISGVTLANGTFTYDGTAKSLTVANLPSGATVTYTGNSQTNAGTYTVNATVSQPNFADQNLSATLTINKAVITASATAKTKVFGDADPSLTYTYTGTLATGDIFTGALSRAAGEAVGTYTINQGTLALSSNYTLSFTPANLTITSATSTAATLANATFTYDGAAKSLTVANLPSGATVTYTGNGQTNAGTYTVTAKVSQPNFADQNLSATLTINKAAIAVSATAKTKVFGDADPSLTYTYTGTLATGDTFTGALSRAAGEAVGTYTINQGTLALSSNYTLSFTPANLTITSATSTAATLANATFTYDGAAKSLAVANLPSGAKVTYTGNGQTNAGTYTVNATVSQPNFADQNLSATLTINKAVITASATAKTKVFGDADPALTYTYTGTLATGDTFTGALSRVTGEAVGTYTINQGTLALSSNYTLSFTPANLTINSATSTAANLANATFTYDGTAKSLAVANLPSGATVTYTANGQTNAGTYTVTATVSQPNFADQNLSATLVINKAVLTITAADQSKTYGAANPVLTVGYSGFVNGESAASLGAVPVVFTSANAASAAGTYTINVNGASAANYTLVYVAGTLTVNKAALNIAANNQNRPYGTANPTLTLTYTGFVNGDNSASLTTQPSVVTTAAATSAIGNYPITVSGAASANYNIAYTAGTLTVAQNVLTITAVNQVKNYGDANPILTLTYNGFVNGDDASKLTTLPTVTTTATTSSNAGLYPITVNGAVTPNYSIVYAPGVLTVNKVPLTVTVANKTKLFGAAIPAFDITYNGFVNGDTQAKLTTLAVAITPATTGSAAGTYPIVVSGAVADNYNISYVNGTLTVLGLSDASLANIVPGNGSLVPVFSSTTLSYAVLIDNAIDRSFLTATLTDANATIKINGVVTGSGRASAGIDLVVGDNLVTIEVTAQDGITKKTYLVTLHRDDPAIPVKPSNIMSPNGDGKNDVWVVKDIELFPNNIVTVFDRAGRAVYTKKGYNNDWNGTLQGAPLTQGTYFYTIDLGAGQKIIRGFITILKSR